MLKFGSGDPNYSVSSPTPSLGLDLVGDADTTFSFRVEVSSMAPSGLDTIDARLVATELLTSEEFVIDGAINTDTWIVQDRPLVAIDSVTVTPSVASTGQAGLSGRIIMTNQAGAVLTAWILTFY
jgi:hypothetical protein